MKDLNELKRVNDAATAAGNPEREYIIENRSIWARSWAEAMHQYNRSPAGKVPI